MRMYDDGEYVSLDGEYFPTFYTVALTALLRVVVVHGAPREVIARDVAPPFPRIVQDGARLRVQLPAYLAQRRTLVDARCPLLPPLQDLVHGYEEPTTTDELWATGLGAPLQRARRSRPERGQSFEGRSAPVISFGSAFLCLLRYFQEILNLKSSHRSCTSKR
jgi:hypothetical protein